MTMHYDIRIELPDGSYDDFQIGAADYDKARQRVQFRHPDYTGWDWRGLVAFVNGAIPAEERVHVG